MKLGLITLLAFIGISNITVASDSEVFKKVMTYFEISGVADLTNNSNQECVSMSSQLMLDTDTLIRQMLIEAQVSMPESKISELHIILKSGQQEFAQDQCNTSSPESELRIMAEEYSKYVAVEDIDAIIAFTKSPAGQKDKLASTKGLEAANTRIWNSRVSLLKSAGEKYSLTVSQKVNEFIQETYKK